MAPGTCRHSARAGLEAVATALDALIAAFHSASLAGPPGEKLDAALDRARAQVAAAAETTDVRVRRRSLRDAKAVLGDVSRAFQSLVRSGKIQADAGLRLLDLSRGTRALIRRQG